MTTKDYAKLGIGIGIAGATALAIWGIIGAVKKNRHDDYIGIVDDDEIEDVADSETTEEIDDAQ